MALLRNTPDTYSDVYGKTRKVNDPEAYISRLHHFYNGLGMSRETDPDARTTHIARRFEIYTHPADMSINQAYPYTTEHISTKVQDEGLVMGHDPMFYDRRSPHHTDEYLHRSPYSLTRSMGLSGDFKYPPAASHSVSKHFSDPYHPDDLDESGRLSDRTIATKVKDLASRTEASSYTVPYYDALQYDDVPDVSVDLMHKPSGIHSSTNGYIYAFGNNRSGDEMLSAVRGIFNRVNVSRLPGQNVEITDTVPSGVMRTHPEWLSPQFLKVKNDRRNRDVIDLKTGTWAKIHPDEYFPN